MTTWHSADIPKAMEIQKMKEVGWASEEIHDRYEQAYNKDKLC